MSVYTSMSTPSTLCDSALCVSFGVRGTERDAVNTTQRHYAGRIPCLLLTHLTLLSFCFTHVPNLPASVSRVPHKILFLCVVCDI